MNQEKDNPCLPIPEKQQLDEPEWYRQINKGTPLEQPLVCNKCKSIGDVRHVEHPSFWRYFLYLFCRNCKFHWRVYYEHACPIEFTPDCTLQDKSASFCIVGDCTNPKMGNYNVCKFHFETGEQK
jgi:hypothetical protein